MTLLSAVIATYSCNKTLALVPYDRRLPAAPLSDVTVLSNDSFRSVCCVVLIQNRREFCSIAFVFATKPFCSLKKQNGSSLVISG